jgi:hypothetical protein
MTAPAETSMWKGFTSGASDLLALVGQYEAQKLNSRFLELENQNRALDAVLKTQNSQAAAPVQQMTFGEWIKANPALAAGIGGGVLLLVWLAVR